MLVIRGVQGFSFGFLGLDSVEGINDTDCCFDSSSILFVIGNVSYSDLGFLLVLIICIPCDNGCLSDLEKGIVTTWEFSFGREGAFKREAVTSTQPCPQVF